MPLCLSLSRPQARQREGLPRTFDPAVDIYPVWSPDGARIAYYSTRGGKLDLYIKAASGAGSDELLFQSPYIKIPSDWSRDGRHLVFAEIDPKTRFDLWPLDGLHLR
ncbi:MAG: PD40 domain-containing protein [Acidobacteriia bacterium]|nr:PD40 domain-containing protein [Terriglobia bacterium]